MHRHTPNRCEIRLREMQAIARRHGGRCLSSKYVHRQVHMEFTLERPPQEDAR